MASDITLEFLRTLSILTMRRRRTRRYKRGSLANLMMPLLLPTSLPSRSINWKGKQAKKSSQNHPLRQILAIYLWSKINLPLLSSTAEMKLIKMSIPNRISTVASIPTNTGGSSSMNAILNGTKIAVYTNKTTITKVHEVLNLSFGRRRQLRFLLSSCMSIICYLEPNRFLVEPIFSKLWCIPQQAWTSRDPTTARAYAFLQRKTILQIYRLFLSYLN